ncbi:hypothetical protein KTQ74_32760, partial [Pseudomonas chlororaphis]|uniref:DUF6531 domain-containing protein n=1 Tax=Pseudomonas chlororaphis TaxID=587753 RepID=UPI001E4E7202
MQAEHNAFKQPPPSLQRKHEATINVRNILYSTLLLTCCVQAEPYTWAISPSVGTKFPSTESACNAYLESLKAEHFGRNPGSPVSFTRAERSKLSETQVKCHVYIRLPSWSSDAEAYSTVAFRNGTHCQDLNDIINPTTDNCGKDQQKGPPPPKSCQANPINIATGGKYQFETDYSAKSNSSLNFSRAYNSLDGAWPHSYSTRLRFAGSTVAALVMHHGRELFFSISGSTVTPRSSGSGVLTKLGTTGWQYISTDNERFTFDPAGKLTRWS